MDYGILILKSAMRLQRKLAPFRIPYKTWGYHPMPKPTSFTSGSAKKGDLKKL